MLYIAIYKNYITIFYPHIKMKLVSKYCALIGRTYRLRTLTYLKFRHLILKLGRHKILCTI